MYCDGCDCITIGLCLQSLKQPLLFLEMLNYLVASLTEAGQVAVLRPVMLIALHVAAVCIAPANKDLVKLWHRVAADWYESCNQLPSAATALTAAGPFGLDEQDVKFYRQDVAVREAHKKRGDVRMMLACLGTVCDVMGCCDCCDRALARHGPVVMAKLR